jgi:hypothetical protein
MQVTLSERSEMVTVGKAPYLCRETGFDQSGRDWSLAGQWVKSERGELEVARYGSVNGHSP